MKNLTVECFLSLEYACARAFTIFDLSINISVQSMMCVKRGKYWRKMLGNVL